MIPGIRAVSRGVVFGLVTLTEEYVQKRSSKKLEVKCLSFHVAIMILHDQ
jgi:hypothetical protein